jgi:hypothetical protein
MNRSWYSSQRRLDKEHCNFFVYKDRAKVPTKYYERLGLKKPESPK